MDKQIKVGSKVKVYNIKSKRIRTLEIIKVRDDGKFELSNAAIVDEYDIEEVVS